MQADYLIHSPCLYNQDQCILVPIKMGSDTDNSQEKCQSSSLKRRVHLLLADLQLLSSCLGHLLCETLNHLQKVCNARTQNNDNPT